MLNKMKSVALFFLTISILINLTITTDEIEPIELRIKDLKRQIYDEMQAQGNRAPEDHYKEMYDYVDNSNKPLVPISDDDERKLHERYKRPELKTTTSTQRYVPASLDTTDEKKKPLRSKKQKKKKSAIETFYRRTAFNPNERNRPQKWTHCLDLLSPFLTGILSNITQAKRVTVTDNVIRRLRQLLTMNMTHASTDDIRTTLYEISNLQLRIFQWDLVALRAILNVIMEDAPHDFKALKYGIKRLFTSWRLNTSNLTRVLTQTRIFRPPCIQITDYSGSTVTPKMLRYTKPDTQKKKTCAYINDEDDC